MGGRPPLELLTDYTFELTSLHLDLKSTVVGIGGEGRAKLGSVLVNRTSGIVSADCPCKLILKHHGNSIYNPLNLAGVMTMPIMPGLEV